MKDEFTVVEDILPEEVIDEDTPITEEIDVGDTVILEVGGVEIASLDFVPDDGEFSYSEDTAKYTGEFQYTTKREPNKIITATGSISFKVSGYGGIIVDASEDNSSLEISLDSNVIKELEDFNVEINTLKENLDAEIEERKSENDNLQAQISDLSANKVNKELKTGSETEYKVLSDNNFTDNDKNEVDTLASMRENDEFGKVDDVKVNGTSIIVDKIGNLTISLDQDPNSSLIYYLKVNDKNVGTINIPKDQFLKSVSPLSEDYTITFTWETSEGEQTTTIDFKSLVDVYKAGNGLELVEGTFNVKLDPSTNVALSVSESGLKLDLTAIESALDDINKEILKIDGIVAENNAEIQENAKEIAKLQEDLLNTTENLQSSISDIMDTALTTDTPQIVKKEGAKIFEKGFGISSEDGANVIDVNNYGTALSFLGGDGKNIFYLNILDKTASAFNKRLAFYDDLVEQHGTKVLVDGKFQETFNADLKADKVEIQNFVEKSKTVDSDTATIANNGRTVSMGVQNQDSGSILGLSSNSLQLSISENEDESSIMMMPDHIDIDTKDLTWNGDTVTTKTDLKKKQDKLTAGTNITIDENNVISASGSAAETDPTVPEYVKNITEQDINNWNNKANLSDIPPTDSEFSLESENPIQNKVITNVVEDINRSLSEAYAEIDKIENDLTDKPSKEEVTTEISDAISAVVDSAPEAFDTLKEIADWIQNDITGTEALVNRVTANETNIASEVTNRESADSEIRSSIPTMLAQLSGDATHQTVSEAEKSTWNDKVSPSALDSYVKKVDASLPTASIEEDYALVANEDGTIYKRAMNKLLDDIGGSTILDDGIRQDSFDVKTLQDQITENSDDIATNMADIAKNTQDINTNKANIETLQTSKQDVLTAGDNITIENGVISAVGGASITVDTALSATSVNPVQNKVITAKVNDLETNKANNSDVMHLTGNEKATGTKEFNHIIGNGEAPYGINNGGKVIYPISLDSTGLYIGSFDTDYPLILNGSDSRPIYQKVGQSNQYEIAFTNDLNDYVLKSAAKQTISVTNGDTALVLKSATSGSAYLQFQDSAGASLGYFGVNGGNPTFYKTSAERLARYSELPTVPVSSVNGKTGAVTLSASDVGALPSSTTVPTAISQLTQDATHRTVTDTEKSTWNGKQSALTFDTTPTANSSNPVTSGGIKTALDGKANTDDIPTNNNQLTNGAGYITIPTTDVRIDSDQMGAYGVKFSNGLIINWGRLVGTKGSVNTVTFAIPFTATTYAVARTPESTSQSTNFQVRGVSITSYSTTNFTYYRASDDAIKGGSFIAIGY